jgi:Rap1a immunity proteins
MTKTIMFTALALAFLTTETLAQTSTGGIQRYVSADTLHEWCERKDIRATYYVAGVLDALMLNANNAPVCHPAESTLAQARDVVCKYLRDNPAKRHYNTASSVWSAQSEAWPCKQ